MPKNSKFRLRSALLICHFCCLANDEPLGVERFHINDNEIQASSRNSQAHYARLMYTQTWYKGGEERESFLEIHMGLIPSLVSAIATQSYDDIVEKYKLAFSRHRIDWFDYREGGETKVSVVI